LRYKEPSVPSRSEFPTYQFLKVIAKDGLSNELPVGRLLFDSREIKPLPDEG